MIWAESIPSPVEVMIILAIMGGILAVMFGGVVAYNLWRDWPRRPKV